MPMLATIVAPVANLAIDGTQAIDGDWMIDGGYYFGGLMTTMAAAGGPSMTHATTTGATMTGA